MDTSVLYFLEKFQENSLMADVNMHIDCNIDILDDGDLPHALIKIAPFITSINSINLPEIDLFEMLDYYYNKDEENKSPLMEMMEKARILLTD
jgi:hypothetical protein